MSRPFTEIPSVVSGLVSDLRDVLFETASRIKDRMSEAGKPVSYPIDWDSPKQKRYVIAKLRREGRLPYVRSDRYRLGWMLERTPLGANLGNKHPAGAIGGTASGWQSRIHRNRWPHLLTVLFEELEKIPSEISNRFQVRSGS